MRVAPHMVYSVSRSLLRAFVALGCSHRSDAAADWRLRALSQCRQLMHGDSSRKTGKWKPQPRVPRQRPRHVAQGTLTLTFHSSSVAPGQRAPHFGAPTLGPKSSPKSKSRLARYQRLGNRCIGLLRRAPGATDLVGAGPRQVEVMYQTAPPDGPKGASFWRPYTWSKV